MQVQLSKAASAVWLTVEPQPWLTWVFGGLRRTGYLSLSQLEPGRLPAPTVSDGAKNLGLGDAASGEGGGSTSWSAAGDLPGDHLSHRVSRLAVSPVAWLVALVVTAAGGLFCPSTSSWGCPVQSCWWPSGLRGRLDGVRRVGLR